MDYAELLRSGVGVLDNTTLISDLVNCRFSNCIVGPEGCGKTTALSMLEHYFDKDRDSRALFADMEVMSVKDGCHDVRSLMNRLTICHLDFSGFNATCFKDARHQIAEVERFAVLGQLDAIVDRADPDDRYDVAVPILRLAAGDDEEAASFIRAMMGCCEQIYGKSQMFLALDGIDRLFDVPFRHGYLEEMNRFFFDWIPDRLPQWVECFLFVADEHENGVWPDFRFADNLRPQSIFDERFLPYFKLWGTPSEKTEGADVASGVLASSFVLPRDLKMRLNAYFERRALADRRREEEIERLRRKKIADYAEVVDVPMGELSPFIGVRALHPLKRSESYRSRDDLLRKLYSVFRLRSDDDVIYKTMQGYSEERWGAYSEIRRFADWLDEEGKKNHPTHRFCTNQDSNWIYFTGYVGDQWYGETDEQVKVYLEPEKSCATRLFAELLESLRTAAKRTFALKISLRVRHDMICVWVATEEFSLVEAVAAKYSLKTELPFVAYRDGMGITRVNRCGDSQNNLQQKLIGSYFSTVDSVDEVSIDAMYAFLVDSWNYRYPDDVRYGKFVDLSAMDLIVLLETISHIVEEKRVEYDSFFFKCTSEDVKRLQEATCWKYLKGREKEAV